LLGGILGSTIGRYLNTVVPIASLLVFIAFSLTFGLVSRVAMGLLSHGHHGICDGCIELFCHPNCEDHVNGCRSPC
jgi:hypothetical protein